MKKVAIGSDHGGLALKEYLKKNIFDCEFLDVGCYDTNSSDYPDFAEKAVSVVLKNEVDCGVLICRSGIGMSIAANRHKGIYAALCFNESMANSARLHNNANILCLSADHLSNIEACNMLKVFLDSDFSKEPRHIKRLEKIDNV